MILRVYKGSKDAAADFADAYYEGEGELTAIADYAFKEHRELTEVSIPYTVKEIGKNAFYNCRNLKKLSFFDRLESLGDGAFRNCSKLSEIEVKSAGGNLRGIKEILASKEEPVMVSIYGNKIFFPHFQQEFNDNVGAKLIAEIMHGAGMNYRECVGRDGIDYLKYDSQFAAQKYSMALSEGINVATARLCYPVELKEEAGEEYLDYLSVNKAEVLNEIVNTGAADTLSEYIKIGLFPDKEAVDGAMDFFCERNFAEAVNIMMEYRDKKFKKISISDMEI